MTFKKISCLALSALLLLSGCSSETTDGYKAGTYTGTAKGFGGDLTVEVVLSTEKIDSVSITAHAETESIGTIAIDSLPEVITSTQAVDFDAISGATVTSEAIRVAVTSALKEAGVDASTLVATGGDDQNAEAVIMDADVVVIGAGGAGMTAAIEAADAGKKVVIIETAAMAGGNTTRATGGMNAGDTSVQDTNEFAQNAGVEKTLEAAKAFDSLNELAATVAQQYADYLSAPEGYFDSVELFMLDTFVGGNNLNNVELVNTLATNSADGIEWLTSVGVDLSAVGSFGGASVMRIHKPVNAEGKTIAVGSYMVPLLETACTDRDVEILYNAHATEITVDENGAVTGVVADGYTVNTTAVVVATGGFGANSEMVVGYKPELAGFVTTNAPSIQGDGIVLAQNIGANTVDMAEVQIHPTVEQASSALITEGLRGDGSILVNAEGLRFIDEVGTRDVVSAAEVAQTGGYAYLIIDQAMVDDSAVIQGYIKKGFTLQGETYTELADAMGVDVAALEATMATWNAAVEAGSDAEFGRTSFADQLVAAPFYAIKIAPGVHHTMGGLEINTNAEVLSTEGTPITGLFAAGEVTGGVHGNNRLGGNAVADIVVFGRIAGQNAAAFAK